jgi:hypothetical protein
MSKFRKVAETQGLPDYIEQQFIPGLADKTDIYANLRESATRHKQVLASESIGEVGQPKINKDWERVASAEMYQQPKFRPSDDEMSNLNPQDSSHRAIRRAGYDTDEGENARPGQYKWGNEGDVMSALIRGATIFENDFEDISQDLIKNNEARMAQFTSPEQREARQSVRHSSWEQEQISMLKPRTISSSRANTILRTGMENVSDGRFGMPNYVAAEDRERQRETMMNAKRDKKLSISRAGFDPEAKHKQWEENIDVYADTFQTYNKGWLDNFGE